MLVRTPYNYDADVVSFQTGLDCSDSPSLAQQHFRDECDINVMVQRFQRTGVPEAPPVLPGVQDFSEVFDFRSAMELVVQARSGFAGLSSSVRERFGNDPARLLDFLNDASNLDEARRLGLVNAPEPEPLVTGGSVPPSAVPSSSSSGPDGSGV